MCEKKKKNTFLRCKVASGSSEKLFRKFHRSNEILNFFRNLLAAIFLQIYVRNDQVCAAEVTQFSYSECGFGGFCEIWAGNFSLWFFFIGFIFFEFICPGFWLFTTFGGAIGRGGKGKVVIFTGCVEWSTMCRGASGDGGSRRVLEFGTLEFV